MVVTDNNCLSCIHTKYKLINNRCGSEIMYWYCEKIKEIFGNLSEIPCDENICNDVFFDKRGECNEPK